MASISGKARSVLRNPETRKMAMEYYQLAGKAFPPFNYDDWYTIDEWFNALTSELDELRKEKAAKNQSE